MGTITHKYRGVHDVELLEADLDLLKFIHIAVVEQGEPMHFQRSLGNTVPGFDTSGTTIFSEGLMTQPVVQPRTVGKADPDQWAEGFEDGTINPLSLADPKLDGGTFNHPTESNEFVRKANELAVQVTGMTYQMLLERLETNGASEQEMMYAWDLDDQFYSGVWDYKPENVFTNRLGTWGDDNSEEILAAGGDPRRPGVKLRPNNEWMNATEDEKKWMQAEQNTMLNRFTSSSSQEIDPRGQRTGVPMPEGGQFKRRGLDAILPGSGLEWGLELGIGAC